MADQRLNIIFTGDVSQLSKAMQSIETDLTKFEQKLKESLGTEAFAGLNKSVDQLREKLSSLKAIDIKANPAQALSTIKEVQSGISSLKASEILLSIDDGKVLGQLQNVDKLLDSLTASIKIDVPDLKPQIEKIRSQLEGLTLDVNASGFDSVIQNIKSKLATLSDEKLNILANGEQAEAVINEILTDIKTLKDAKVLISADGTQAEGVIDSIQSDLQNLKGSLQIDTTEFQRKLAQITSGVSEINLKADTSQIDSSIKAIRQRLASINITANPDDAFSALREISTELNKIKSSQVFINLDDDKAVQQIHDLDKLLDDLTATIRIDADVKSQIDKIKSQLAGFTIDINADASNTEAVLKNIQSKLSLLQDEKFIISADGKQAEAIIDEIFADLKSLKDTKVLINADGTPAISTLENIQNKLEETLQGGKLTIDTSELQSKLESIRSLSGELVIESDVSQVENSIKSIRDKLAAFKTIDIDADPQGALTAINEILTQIAKIKSNELILKSDNTDVLADINQIQTKLQDIKTNINITANLDTKNLEALLKPLSTQVSVSVNTKQAEAELKALLAQVRGLKGQNILINLDGTQVVKTIDAIEKELLQLQAKLKTATNPADIARLTQQLQTFKSSLSATNVNQFSSSMGKAQQTTMAFSQVLREAPAFAFSFQTGILAISNNLPILADRLKEARAAGMGTKQIIGDLAKSLVSLPGLLTIASTALIFLAGSFNNASKKADVMTETFSEVATSTGAEIIKIEAAVSVLKNFESSLTAQKNAREFLNKEVGISNELLSKEKINSEETAKAIAALTEGIYQKALAEALANKVAERQAKVIELQAKAAGKAGDVVKALSNNVITSLIGQKAITEVAFINKNIAETNEEIKTLKALSIQAFADFFNSPNFKKGAKDFKDQTDDIIARAKAFVKQFGEVFVTPDLEESFTNTKDKILKSAKQLIDDINNQNLIIKLPLSTDLDFTLTPNVQEEITKFTTQVKDRIKEGIEQGVIQVKPQLSINPPTPEQGGEQPQLISKKQTEELDKLTEGFVNLGDRGIKALEKIDFSDVNKGIADAAKSLKRLNEEFQITKDVGDVIGESFASAFNALFENEDPIKAFFRSIINGLQQLIAKLIATKIAAAFLNLVFPGSSSAIGGLGKLVGGLGGQANFGLGGGGLLRGIAVSVSGSVIQRGSDLTISFNNSGRSLGRIQ